MFRRRDATRAGETLNEAARLIDATCSEVTTAEVQRIENAVRLANAIIYQYFLIPREVREQYFRKELVSDGVRLQAPPEE